MLFKLADNKDAAGDVASAVAENLDKLVVAVYNLDNLTVVGNFDELPDEVRNLLFKLKIVQKRRGLYMVSRVNEFKPYKRISF